MCKYSLEGYGTRRAKEGETLVANQHLAREHGCLTQPGTDMRGTLTCVREGTKLTIEKLQLISSVNETTWVSWSFNAKTMEYVGKHVVVQLLDGRVTKHGLDILRIVGDRRVNMEFPLLWLKPGTEVYVGVKKEVTLDEKVGIDAATLKKVALDMSDPKDKEGEEEEKKKERETPPEEREPATPREAARSIFGIWR